MTCRADTQHDHARDKMANTAWKMFLLMDQISRKLWDIFEEEFLAADGAKGLWISRFENELTWRCFIG